MRDDRFEHWSRGLMLRGQRQLAETLRVLVYKTAPALFEKLDFDNDECFLDPLLFAWFTSPARDAYPLEQILYGVLNGAFVSDTGIQILPARHTLLDRFFVDANGNPVCPEVPQIVARHTAHLNIAFDLIATYCPDIAIDIAATTRRVLLYRSPTPNSFATLSAHGAVFLNVPESADEVYFVEDLAHQSAHVLFNALTIDKRRFLAVDPATPLSNIANDPDEPRHIYSAFHGLFTYTIICQVLSTLRERLVFHGRKAHELLGRLGFTLNKFGWDLAQLDKRDLFTARGWLCYQHFAAQYAQRMAADGNVFRRLNFSNQPYNFDYERFATLNPSFEISWLAPTTALAS